MRRYNRIILLGITLATLCGTFAQSVPPRAFEVASIKVNPGPWHVRLGYSPSDPRLTLEAYSGLERIMEAYHVKRYMVSYSTSYTEFYDIVAKAEGDGSPTRAEFRLMLQTLLADRFKLKLHREMREMPVYALVVGKNGPKFGESAPDAPRVSNHGVNGRKQNVTLSQATMESLADEISVDRPVIDKTGLTGAYDIKGGLASSLLFFHIWPAVWKNNDVTRAVPKILASSPVIRKRELNPILFT